MRCDHCNSRMFLQRDYIPEKGYDPKTRKYVCGECGRTLYTMPKALAKAKGMEELING